MPVHSDDLTTKVGWSESVDNAQFTLGDPVAVFPLAGYRDDYGPEDFVHAYDRAVYWTAYASADAKTGYYAQFQRACRNKPRPALRDGHSPSSFLAEWHR